MEIIPVEYSLIEPWRAAAFKEDTHLYQGEKPIQWFGAIYENELVGCIGLLQPYNSKKEVRVRGWYVAPAFRGFGYGTALLIFAIEEAKRQGYATLEIKTKYHELAAGCGFMPTGKEYKSFGGQKTKQGIGKQLVIQL